MLLWFSYSGKVTETVQERSRSYQLWSEKSKEDFEDKFADQLKKECGYPSM